MTADLLRDHVSFSSRDQPSYVPRPFEMIPGLYFSGNEDVKMWMTLFSFNDIPYMILYFILMYSAKNDAIVWSSSVRHKTMKVINNPWNTRIFFKSKFTCYYTNIPVPVPIHTYVGFFKGDCIIGSGCRVGGSIK